MKIGLKMVLASFSGICIGLIFHPSGWSTMSMAFLSILLILLLISSINAKWGWIFLLLIPLLFQVFVYAGEEGNLLLYKHDPGTVLGEIMYSYKETGKSSVSATVGVSDFVKSGDPIAIANSGFKPHYFMIFIVIIVFGFVFCAVKCRSRSKVG